MMNRRSFVRTSGAALGACTLSAFSQAESANKDKLERIALGTLIFRYRFKQTKPKQLETIKDELTLLDVPEHHRDRFGIRKIEFWNEHFESLEPDYLEKLKGKIKAAGSELLNVQIDRISYDLAATNEEQRTKSVKAVKEWMDAASFLGSRCVRINPGSPRGTVEQSIASLKELNAYAKEKKLIIITANHFGIEMDADKHVAIVQGSGVHTEPDFGNYPADDQLYTKLTKIVPHAYIVSAKTVDFDSSIKHTSYDFVRCVQTCENLGFRGPYMVSQYSGKFQDIDYSKVADWIIQTLKDNILA